MKKLKQIFETMVLWIESSLCVAFLLILSIIGMSWLLKLWGIV